MIPLSKSEIELMKSYILGKNIYERVFPEFYDRIAREVEKALRPQYPLLEPDVGPRDRARAMTKFPELGEKVPLDWVAFGFFGIDLYDFHIGVILLMKDWPVRYHMGLHIMDSTWSFVQKEAALIDWKKNGLNPTYVFEAPVREHRYIDPVREFDFSNLDGEIKHISDRVIHFYRTSAPVAAKWANRRKG
jgi:hypothetical protein